mgnify:CR=1 FL=1
MSGQLGLAAISALAQLSKAWITPVLWLLEPSAGVPRIGNLSLLLSGLELPFPWLCLEPPYTLWLADQSSYRDWLWWSFIILLGTTGALRVGECGIEMERLRDPGDHILASYLMGLRLGRYQ